MTSGGGIYDGEEWFNQIFLAECDNSGAPSNGLVLVLGGIYAPEGVSDAEEMSYYRVNMVNNIGTVDIIRNHSYIFKIMGVENVGTSDPDPDRATDGLVVEIEDYTDEEMKGINSQYTLTVNQSAFAFNSVAAEYHTLEIETDGTTWSWDNGVYYRGTDGDGNVMYFVFVVSDENGNVTVYDGETLEPLALGGSPNAQGLFIENGYVFYQYSTADGVSHTVLVNWLNVYEGDNQTPTSGSFGYAAEPNVGTWEFNRYAYLYITAGSIRKQIQFAQPVGESANSMIITKEGTYAFNATERGNGGTAAETDDGTYDENINFAFSTSLNKEDIALVDVIWETSDGLVTVAWDEEAQELFSKTGCVRYTVNNVRMYTPDGEPSYTGYWGGYVFDEGNGGNALIGAFDANNMLLWSWHIWVVPDYFDGVKTELWGTGYEYMDRNLGAYSNLPGSKSFGLLYQWGRKDPFIGAYREDRERDYHTVPKQYTKMYSNPAGGTWAWGDFDDSVYGGSYDGEEAILEYTVHYPTTLLDDGLLSGDHAYGSAHGLWGCESTDVQEEEHGSKTMWDPCPEGYRVPTLNALTIYDGANDMWYIYEDQRAGMVQTQHASQTLRYVPIVNDGVSEIPWQTGGNTSTFVSDAPFYGFWLEYGDWGGTGYFASNYASSYGVGYYDTANDPNFTSFGYIDGYVGSKPDWATWLPLSGIYNGSMDHFGRAGMTDQGPDGDPYLPASSLQVTSVLWGNSPTSTNSDYPGGLLLHGTEGAYTLHNGTTMYEYSAGTANGTTGNSSDVATEGEGYWTNVHSGASNTVVAWWTGTDSNGQWNYNGSYVTANTASWSDENGMPGSGRHFHSFADPTISTLANPSYAASVRCIVDKQRLNAASNVIYEADGSTVASGSHDLYQHGGTAASSTTFALNFVIYSIESWQVSNPGAKWLSVSPLSGNTSDAYGNSETLTVKYNTSTSSAPSVGDEATITVKFLSGGSQTITVRYAGEYSGR